MRPTLSSLLHRTPWWGLLAGGFGLFVALVLFVTPFHFIKLEQSGATPEENRAIKREIDVAFSESAIDIARKVVREMRDHAKDPQRREELDQALVEMDQARESLREAGAEVARAKRTAAEDVTRAVKDAQQAIRDAQKEAAQALKDAGVEGEKVQKSLEDSLKAAQAAGEEAKRAERDPKGPPRIVVMTPGKDKPLVDIDINASGGGASASVHADLPPELRNEIRKKLTTDLYRIGIGSGLILIFIPLFILAVVSKFFIDRSRAAQGMAESKRKEAEYHRMSRQVTEAKLSALQAQVEPHFLYNTLASVQALTEVDPAQASAMTGHLIQYLRNALPKMRESVSTVGQEIELVRAYLNILQMRMGKRLAFEIDVPQELLEAPFPPLMLPSLVENAIKHGLEAQREGGMVTIGASEAGGKLRVTVADTGRGFAETVGTGVGLTNIRERLAALYGEAGRLTLEAREPHGVVATIEVPRETVGATRAAQPGAPWQSAQPEQPAQSSPPPLPPAAGPAQPAVARTRSERALSTFGAVERAWRKGLTYTFLVLVVVAAIVAAFAALGVLTGTLPVMLGEEMAGTGASTVIGTAGVVLAFIVVVLALAIVLAVIYGLGFFLAGLAVFVGIIVLVALFPLMAPFILLGLGIWWLVRRNKEKSRIESPHAHGNPR
jgi:histidine kinase/histidine kinase/DNA gyrase B/HSP90-like ATPase